jgi:hypothetical protein
MPVDPSAAPGGGSGAAALDALVTAELNALAADAQALQNQVAIGDILNATVLPSNGLSDLVNIQGNRVAASLPPTLTPGDQITVQVTGFNGPQILLQILSTSDGAPPGGATAAPPPGQSAEPATDGPPGTIPGAPGTTISSPVFGGIEARLAAARAASVTITAPGRSSAASLAGVATRSATAPRPPSAPASAPAAAAGTTGAAARGPAFVPVTTGRAFVVPPQIATSPYAGSPAAATAGAASEGGEAATSGVATFQDPLALVRALNLPVTPSNLAAAKLALDAPQRLPAALATLESALPQSDDPRVATLRTIAAFVGKMEPSSPQLATQIAAYVDHVVSGSEPALAQLLAAHVAEAAPLAGETAPVAAAVAVDAEAPATATAPASGAAPAAAASEAAAAANEPTLPVVALAQVVERAAAIAVSLKEQLFSLVNAPPAGGHDAEAIAPSAASALTAVTSVQMAAAQAAAGSPQTMSFSLPMWLGSSYAQAQIAVGRDAPDTPNVPLDGDNFHIAFVLDTKNLGTVAVDLRTVGRSFALSVKTENLRTAQRFGDELSRLTDRLSSLRYQPKSVEAVVAAAPGAAVAPAIGVAAATGAPAATDAPAAAAETGFNERA